MKIKTILFLSILSILTAQGGPAKALHRNPPRAWALTNATIYAAPGKTIEDGTVVMRDGIITAVGAKVKIPKQATIIDMDGKHIYAGFIESWLDVKTVKKDTSLQPAVGFFSDPVRPLLREPECVGGPGDPGQLEFEYAGLSQRR